MTLTWAGKHSSVSDPTPRLISHCSPEGEQAQNSFQAPRVPVSAQVSTWSPLAAALDHNRCVGISREEMRVTTQETSPTRRCCLRNSEAGRSRAKGTNCRITPLWPCDQVSVGHGQLWTISSSCSSFNFVSFSFLLPNTVLQEGGCFVLFLALRKQTLKE